MMSTHCGIIRSRTLLSLKDVTSQPTTSPSSKPFPFSLTLQSPTSSILSASFPVSYLINTFGLSPQSASKLCSTHKLRFKTPQNPDSVITFFKNHGFSDTQLHDMIQKAPWLLSCDPYKRVLPKFQFFQSKGASTSHIVSLVSKNPKILGPTLENQILPAYELVYRYLKSDKATLDLLNSNPALFADPRVEPTIRVLIENGVTDSNIAIMLQIGSLGRVFNELEEHDMVKLVDELKGLGFDPSKSTFPAALVAKTPGIWNKKVEAFKKWGWSDEDIMVAFRRYPSCMLASIDKINSVMSFWVNQLGWNALALVRGPIVFGLSLEKRIIPRASVLQYLLEKGLRKKNASLTSPFLMIEELFLEKFIKQFVEDSSYLLKLYEDKLKLVSSSDKTGMNS